jgi:4-hydroxymandelate oxidase
VPVTRPERPLPPANLLELEERAKEKLEKTVYDYFAGGSHDETALRANIEAFAKIALYHRVLVDVSRRTTETTVLGARIRLPVLVAPTAFHRLAHHQGELATVRAAGAAGTVMVLSSLSNTLIEDVLREATGPVWFQVYVYRDRQATEAMVARAEAAGCRALVLTVDTPIMATRERDVKNRFALPPALKIANMLPAGYGSMTTRLGTVPESALASYVADRLDPALRWEDVMWLRSITKLPLVLKGIVRPDDARRAVAAGVNAIIVSNHGGRQLDSSPATLEALPRVAAAVGNDCEVLMDGGVRRGTDVLKALALGARAVLVGRPILWGLAYDGRAGVEHVLASLQREIDEAMALCGCPTTADVTRDLVYPDD